MANDELCVARLCHFHLYVIYLLSSCLEYLLNRRGKLHPKSFSINKNDFVILSLKTSLCIKILR